MQRSKHLPSRLQVFTMKVMRRSFRLTIPGHVDLERVFYSVEHPGSEVARAIASWSGAVSVTCWPVDRDVYRVTYHDPYADVYREGTATLTS